MRPGVLTDGMHSYTLLCMKILFWIAVFLLPITVLGHPGKTDRHGGHKCLKGCEVWNLYYAEYHLHDKDGRAIRVKRKTPKEIPVAAVPATVESVPPPAPEAAPVPAPLPVPAAAPEEAELIPLPWALILVFLLLFLLARRRVRKENNKIST